MYERCIRGVSRVYQECCRGVSGVFHGCFRGREPRTPAGTCAGFMFITVGSHVLKLSRPLVRSGVIRI